MNYCNKIMGWRGLGATVFLWLVLLLPLSPALAAPEGGAFVLGDLRIPAPTGYVNDIAGILSPNEVNELEGVCRRIDRATGAQIAIAIIPDLAGETAGDVRTRLFETWQVGRKDDNRGLLILHAVAERRVEVEVGYDLEGVITDARAGRILDETLVPRFRAGDYFGGYRDGLSALYERISGDESSRAGRDAYRQGGSRDSGGPQGGSRGFPWGSLLLAPIFLYLLIKHPRLLLLLLLSGMGGGRRGGQGGSFGGGFGGFGGGMSGGGGAGRSY